MKPRLLDLFCGAGGAARGYQLAGFHVTGVDINPQPNYAGDRFVQADIIAWADIDPGFINGLDITREFDAIHASPPCQAYSKIAKQIRKLGKTQNEHPDLVPQTRALLQATGLPYVIENVVGAPLKSPIQLCGSSFGLNVRRHRLFECGGFDVGLIPPCAHHWQTPRFRSLDKRSGFATVVGVHGNLNYAGERALREWAIGIDWMSPYELTQAIPPAYTEFIGAQLLAHLEATRPDMSPTTGA